MIFQITVPAAVPGVEEIRVLEWHVTLGSAIAAGDLIVELETHKAIIEVRAGQAGFLLAILVQGGDWRAIGLPLALVSSDPEEELPGDTSAASAMLIDFEVN